MIAKKVINAVLKNDTAVGVDGVIWCSLLLEWLHEYQPVKFCYSHRSNGQLFHSFLYNGNNCCFFGHMLNFRFHVKCKLVKLVLELLKPSVYFLNIPDLNQLQVVLLLSFSSIFFKYWLCIGLFFQFTNRFSIVSFLYLAFTFVVFKNYLWWTSFLQQGFVGFSWCSLSSHVFLPP